MYNDNPRISRLLFWVTSVETAVLLVAGVGLLLLPSVIRPLWPWELSPFNAVLMGAAYTASMTATAMTVYVRRWAPARIVVPMILLFTTVVLAVSLLNLERFDFAKFGTWAWFLLYVAIPVNALYFMWLTRGLPPYFTSALGTPWRAVLLIPIMLLGVYGLALLFMPETSSGFWPWPIDGFHAQTYSVLYLTPALGAILLWKAAASVELLTLGLTLAVGGLIPVVGVAIVNLDLDKIDWTQPGTWLWNGSFMVLFLVGVGMMWRSRSQEPQPERASAEA